MAALGLPKEYGYCILVAADSALVIAYLGIRVGRARKQFGVEVKINRHILSLF